MGRTKVLLTGATGNMGSEALRQLYEQKERYHTIVFSLPTKSDKKKLAKYENNDSVSIVWGDLTKYDDVKRAVEAADIVLHVGGMVSPMADYYPELTMKVNVGGVKNIIQAIKEQPDPDKIKLVYIGSVAETGDRSAPIHWGRTGDPIKISAFDYYAISKTLAEREVIESGLKYWVSLRQTGMLYPDIVKTLDPIMFHEPINGVFEWSTAVDSGRLLVNVCDESVPYEFWRRIYNIGGGKHFRTNNWEFMFKSFGAIGIKDFRKATELNWFATRNFHGQWYEDSDELERYLHFRSSTLDEFFESLKKSAPRYMKLAKLAAPSVIKNLVFKPVARKPLGPLHWIENNDTERINAFFGSKEQWAAIPDWEHAALERYSEEPTRLNHGYDESKPKSELVLEDMQQAAQFRGGRCWSESMTKGDLYTKLTWECAFGHRFEASPALVLLGGHWCSDCLPAPWRYDEEAQRNPFFAQVWTP